MALRRVRRANVQRIDVLRGVTKRGSGGACRCSISAGPRSGGAAGGRVDWADTAKALSIILLVFWTLEGTSIGFNQMLILARMPLFFFVSGLFAWRVILRTDLRQLRAREGRQPRLSLRSLGGDLSSPRPLSSDGRGGGRRSTPGRWCRCFWQPFVPMWFFYGLAIAFLVAFLCRGLPIVLVTALSLIAYGVVVCERGLAAASRPSSSRPLLPVLLARPRLPAGGLRLRRAPLAAVAAAARRVPRPLVGAVLTPAGSRCRRSRSRSPRSESRLF